MTNEEANELVEEYWEAYPEPGGVMEFKLCLLYDNAGLTDEDRDHLAEELDAMTRMSDEELADLERERERDEQTAP